MFNLSQELVTNFTFFWTHSMNSFIRINIWKIMIVSHLYSLSHCNNDKRIVFTCNTHEFVINIHEKVFKENKFIVKMLSQSTI